MVAIKLFNVISTLSLIHMFFKVVTSCTQQCKGEDSVTGKMLKGFTFKKMKVKSPSECLQVCKDNESCHSFNYVMLEDICELNNRTGHAGEITPEELEDDPRRYFFQVKRLPPPLSESCASTLKGYSKPADGTYELKVNSSLFLAYCNIAADGQVWTLVARFSNKDAKNWMKNNGEWWYDKTVAVGAITDPSSNYDMISPAFWMVSGNELKITRSDDPQHIALLQTTDDCLDGKTFRTKITSYGNFRNAVWASSRCQGRCSVRYGGQYSTTQGFGRATCNGQLQSADNIGFWCDWSAGDGSVMMIGGGGDSCWRADHGIGITEADAASFFWSSIEDDFGNGPGSYARSYSLNLWIR